LDDKGYHPNKHKGEYNMSTFRSRRALVANYRSRITDDMKFALMGLYTIFNNQLNDEIETDSTHHKNRKGFNKADAKILSRIAKSSLDGNTLGDSEIDEIKKRMPKYAKQLVRSAIKSGSLVKQNGVYTVD